MTLENRPARQRLRACPTCGSYESTKLPKAVIMDKGVTAKSSAKQSQKDPGRAPKSPQAESARLRECHESVAPWKKWGPYVSERQ